MSIPYGVYIGKDIEVVCTEQYTMAFRRNNMNDFLESMLLNSDRKCIGICRTTPCSSNMSFLPDGWEYAMKRDKKIYSDKNILHFINAETLAMSEHQGYLTVQFYDGTRYMAQADELFTMEHLNPTCFSSNDRSISDCLIDWNVGCKDIIWNGQNIGLTINTHKHMYIYEMTKDSIYCRAARYRTCDKGVVFNQNFRQGHNAYMVADNTVAMQELPYDESFFSREACVWNERSVYWSVALVEEDRIELHGCQGDKYEWKKPR